MWWWNIIIAVRHLGFTRLLLRLGNSRARCGDVLAAICSEGADLVVHIPLSLGIQSFRVEDRCHRYIARHLPSGERLLQKRTVYKFLVVHSSRSLRKVEVVELLDVCHFPDECSQKCRPIKRRDDNVPTFRSTQLGDVHIGRLLHDRHNILETVNIRLPVQSFH